MSDTAKKPYPPHVAYTTFKNYITSLRDNLPGRIDRSVMRGYSGTTQNQLSHALKFFYFINQEGFTQELLRQIVKANDAGYKKILQDLLHEFYPFAFNQPNFNLGDATPSQFYSLFQNHISATGETERKCRGFFLNAARDAGIEVSKHITPTSMPKANGGKRGNRHKASSDTKETSKARANEPLRSTNSHGHDQFNGVIVTLPGRVQYRLQIDGDPYKLQREVREFVFGQMDAAKGFAEENEEHVSDEEEEDI